MIYNSLDEYYISWLVLLVILSPSSSLGATTCIDGFVVKFFQNREKNNTNCNM